MKAIYARQSIDKKDSLSIEGQIEQCKTKIKDQQYKTYEDHGYSGKNIERPQMKQLINDIEKGIIEEVIVYRLDRFSRNIIDFYKIYEVMQQHNCGFISISENFDTSSPMGRATMSILITFAQMERESICQRVKDNYYYRVNDGRWAGGPAPYGYKNGRINGKPALIPIDEEINIIKYIFYLYENEVNISLNQICRILDEKGFRSRKKSGGWDNCIIAHILQNTLYVEADEKLYKFLEIKQIKFSNDKKEWNGTRTCHIVGKKTGNVNIRKYEDLKGQTAYLLNVKPIISSRSYINIMGRLAQNEQLKRSNGTSRLKELSGKLKCECGYAIKSYAIATDGRPYLACYNNTTLHRCENKFTQFNFWELQKQVGEQIQQQLDGMNRIMADKRKVKNGKKKEIEKLNGQLNNLVEMASQSDLLSQAVLKKIENTQKRINELELELQIDMDVIDNLEIPNFGTHTEIDYKTLSTDEKKYIVNLLIDKIVLCQSGDIKIFWKI